LPRLFRESEEDEVDEQQVRKVILLVPVEKQFAELVTAGLGPSISRTPRYGFRTFPSPMPDRRLTRRLLALEPLNRELEGTIPRASGFML
jgi:hypothetical protein